MGFENKHETLAHVIFCYNTQESSWKLSSWVTGSFGYGSSKASSYEGIREDIR